MEIPAHFKYLERVMGTMAESREVVEYESVSEEVLEQLRRSERDIEEGRVRPVEELLEELQ